MKDPLSNAPSLAELLDEGRRVADRYGQCAGCLRYQGWLKCPAFSGCIPPEILTGEHDHRTIWPGQIDGWTFLEESPSRNKGGPGSGNFGHAGRPGQIGGSAPDEGGEAAKPSGGSSASHDFGKAPPTVRTWAERKFGDATKAAAFCRWFGESKVVDEQGEPLVVYRGHKDAEIAGFENGEVVWNPKDTTLEHTGRIEPGIWFSPDSTVAAKYGTPVAYYLKAERLAREEAPISEKPANSDGVYRMRGKGDSVSRAWEIAVFSPSQAKLAIGNAGTFDPTSPDIRKSPLALRKSWLREAGVELWTKAERQAEKELEAAALRFLARQRREAVAEVKRIADEQPQKFTASSNAESIADEAYSGEDWDKALRLAVGEAIARTVVRGYLAAQTVQAGRRRRFAPPWTTKAVGRKGGVRYKGGPGSGNFGHAGIPGHLGGSAEGEGADSYAATIADSPVEKWAVFSPEGTKIREGEGGQFSASIVGGNLRDQIVVHNHPGANDIPLSPQDLTFAAIRDLASMKAVTRTDDKRTVLYTMDRPKAGWPKDFSERMGLDEKWLAVYRDVRKEEPDLAVASHKTWQIFSSQTGVGYERRVIGDKSAIKSHKQGWSDMPLTEDEEREVMSFRLPPSVTRRVFETVGEVMRQPYWKDINDVGRERMRWSIHEGIEEGKTLDQIVKDIEGDVSVDEVRARRIATTESNNAIASGHWIQAKEAEDAGVPVTKTWTTVGDDKVRQSHMDMDGTVVEGADGLFDVEGVLVPWPGHVDLPAELRIGCRCTLIIDALYPSETVASHAGAWRESRAWEKGGTFCHAPPAVEVERELLQLDTSKGGPGSGNFGHAGRPGQVGGSAEGEGGTSTVPTKEDVDPYFGWSGNKKLKSWMDDEKGGLRKMIEGSGSDLQEDDYPTISNRGGFQDPGKAFRSALKTTVSYSVGHDMAKAGVTKEDVESLISDPAMRRNIRAYEVQPGSPTAKVASALVEVWAEHASDNSPMSLAIQASAAKVMGLNGYAKYDAGANDEVKAERDRILEKHGKVLEAYAKSVYDNTQACLKEAGVKDLILFRGMSFQPGQSPEWVKHVTENGAPINWADQRISRAGMSVSAKIADKMPVQLNPVSSFTTDYGTATGFGEGAPSGGRAAVIAMKVPREQIWSMSFTGPGCAEENEAIVVHDSGQNARTAIGDEVLPDEANFWRTLREKKAAEERPPTVTPDDTELNCDWPKKSDDRRGSLI